MPGSGRAALLFALALIAPVAVAADPTSLGDLIASADGAVRPLAAEELELLLRHGAERRLTVFELFDEVIQVLAARGQGVAISGELLRAAAVRFDLGGDRVASLLPVDKVARITLGCAGAGAPGQLNVLLSEEHAQYLELADIRLSSRYGFKDVRPGMFAGGYGATVRRLLFSFNLDRIELYDRSKIAIHVRGFPQPKRWRIPRITPR